MTGTVKEAYSLEVEGLTKRFPGVLALDDVSVAFRPGEIHALVGQNGAGKSTLINVLSGMYRPDAGEIRVGGQAVAIGSTRHAAECGIATVYQELSLLPNLTVAQNLALGREPRRFGLLDTGAMQRSAADALQRIGAAIEANRLLASLSVAERQLVEIAKALSRQPTILILDEPTAPLAKREADRLFGILHSLRSSGMTIVFVSHRFREILDHCDRGTVLRNGRMVLTTELAGWSEADLTEAMIGRQAESFTRKRASRSSAGGQLPNLLATEVHWKDKVRGISLEVAEGEILGITGLLGAGQNEIGRLIGGDLVADRGAIAVQGRAVTVGGPADANRAGISLLTDDRKGEGILPNLPVRENTALPSLGKRRSAGIFVKRSAERAAVFEALTRFDVVTRSPGAPMRTLSGGNQQKALLARWDLAGSNVFVLIEPTRGVDVGSRADIYRRLEVLAAAGKSVVVVSSDIPEVLAIADRILVVRDGEIAAEALPGSIDEERLNLLVQGAA